MALQVIGAGLGRTATNSLKLALERLLGAPCYHMLEVLAHPDHVAHWHAAALGEQPDWDAVYDGFRAAVDWPTAAFWRELMAVYPDAIVLLSVRDPESWWTSAHNTIFRSLDVPGIPGDMRAMIEAMFAARFTRDLGNKAACIA